MFDIIEVLEPKSLEEALKIINFNEGYKIIAGGTDVLIKLHNNKINNARLVCIKDLEELKGIKLLDNDDVLIGANSTFSDIFRNKTINDNIKILSEAAISIGGPQIRNVGTIGGNVCNGAVSADSAPALLALNSILKIKGIGYEKDVKIAEFYESPGKVKINNNEILTQILIKKEDYINKRGKYIKFSNRKSLDISILGVAVMYEVVNNMFVDLRIALGVAAPTPIRCTIAEEFAIGKEISYEAINNIAELTIDNANPRNSWRSSRDYRMHLIKTLVARILKNDLLRGEC